MEQRANEVEIAKLWGAVSMCKEAQKRQQEAHDKMEVRSTKALEEISHTITKMGNDFRTIKWSVIGVLVGIGIGVGALNYESILSLIS